VSLEKGLKNPLSRGDRVEEERKALLQKLRGVLVMAMTLPRTHPSLGKAGFASLPALFPSQEGTLSPQLQI